MMKAFVIPSGLIPPSTAAYIPKLIQGYSLRTEWLEMRRYFWVTSTEDQLLFSMKFTPHARLNSH